ncbi:MAG TPA: Gfo/Idh/MocA family oxidoreductase, partial [Acidobacteriota bacterium]|nr:Gfo/Idh/MocA family oxidoreductase [Acidobacteriota bacterium]
MKVNRRTFISSTAAAVGTTRLTTASQRSGANDQIGVALIGCGGMGRADIRDFMRVPEVQVRAVCDVWEHNLERAARMTEDQPSGRAAGFTDFRRVLELKEIDVVVVATPDHWHALPTIMACEAGKDVYVEKPLSLTVEEGRKMVEAARRNQRVVQMGTQQRSGLHYQEAVRLIQDGVIGKISRVSAWNYENETPAGIGNPPDGNPPS